MGYLDELNNARGGLLLPPGDYDLHVDSLLFGQIQQNAAAKKSARARRGIAEARSKKNCNGSRVAEAVAT